MVQLFLNTNFSDQGLFDFAAGERGLFNFLDSDQHIGCFVLGQLHLTVGSFSEVGFSSLNKLEIFFADGAKHLLKSNLLWGESALVVSFFNERSGCLNSMHIGEENTISCLRLLP